MSKQDRSYSDAMNEWAAKQSFLRNRRNRFLHPNPEQPAPLRALGYLIRIAIAVFVLWLIVSKFSSSYYNGSSFNEKLREEIQTLAAAEEVFSSDFTWQGNKASSKMLSVKGSETAFYRQLDALNLSFDLPFHKRLRSAWTIAQMDVEKLTLELKSEGKAGKLIGATAAQGEPLIAAGLLPTPDFSKLTITRVNCDWADFTWGASRATRGGLEGASFDLFSGSPDWQLDLEGGTLRQNWLRDLTIESARVRRKGDRLVISDAELRPGRAEESGTLNGQVTLGELPQLALQLELPAVDTTDLLPEDPELPEYFYGTLNLSAKISGSINSLTGITTSGKAVLTKGTFNKIPVFEAIDQLLKSNSFRMFSPDEGEFEFETTDGVLKVTNFECRSRAASAMIRGAFTYTAASTDANGLKTGIDEIKGKLQLGIRPSRLVGNRLAKTYFSGRADGYAWIDIPLEKSLKQATRDQQGEIVAELRKGDQ